MKVSSNPYFNRIAPGTDCRAKARRWPTAADGFSLVEVMLAATLMVIVAVSTAVLFTLSNKQTLESRVRQAEQSAISDDLATIQRLNDRYSCASGSCRIATVDPGEDDYYPGTAAARATIDAQCSSGALIDNLITAIDTAATPASFGNLGIRRRSASANSDDPATNRYMVTWSGSDGRQLRQVTLVPTMAGWCP